MTMRNDAAWHAGHETARPYLLAVAWVGILGIVATVVAVVTGGLSLGDPMAVAASIVILGLQGVLVVVAAVWAIMAARYF